MLMEMKRWSLHRTVVIDPPELVEARDTYMSHGCTYTQASDLALWDIIDRLRDEVAVLRKAAAAKRVRVTVKARKRGRK